MKRGCPEAYIMADQFAWIKKELKKGEADSTVKYIILFAQEPIFPNGGHVQDCMWYRGDNRMRAYSVKEDGSKPLPTGEGILTLRNKFATLVGQNKKVAAVLGCDEHSYHKILIDKNVPIGVMELDDKNKDNRIDTEKENCSPLKALTYPTWYLVSGGAGAPYYSEQDTPWNRYWNGFKGTYPNHTSTNGCYYYSSQEHIFIVRAGKTKISLEVRNPYGEIIDAIDNLMEVKKNAEFQH